MPALHKYQLNRAVRLHWACWDDEYVVFEEASGQTHQMDPLRAFLLNSLSERPATRDALVTELQHIPGLSATLQSPELLDTHLREMCTLGLVEMAPA